MNEAQSRMLPAHQRFHADQMKIVSRDLGLVLKEKFVSVQALSQITFEHQLLERPRRSTRGVELMIVAALHLRALECNPGSLQQTGSVASVLRIQADTNAGGDEDILIVEDKSLIESLLDRACDIRGVLRARDLRQQDCKLISTETRNRVAVANTTSQTLGH